MKLRIVAGEGPIAALGAGHDLTQLHVAPGLLIEGSSRVRWSSSTGLPLVFLAGHVVGVRGRTGETQPLTPGFGDWPIVIRQALDHRLDTLEGRFAVVSIEEDGHCRICTDRFGQMDLYYQRVGAQFVIATDLSLLPVSGGTVEYDQAALAHVLCVFGWRPPKQHTLYRGVQRLGVGQHVTVKEGRTEIVDGTFRPIPMGQYGERELDEYGEILLEAVRVRGSQYGNVVYLSSGWDSTAILACLVKLFGARKVRAVIGRMQYAERSGVINQIEIDRARAVADYYGVPLAIAEFDYRTEGPELFEQLRPLLRSHQIAGLGALNHWHLANYVARTTNGDEAVFAGEISDGAHNLGFSQYLTVFHPSYAFREYSDKMASYLFGPSFFVRFIEGKFASDPIYTFLRGRCGDATFDTLSDGGRSARARQLLASFFLRANRIPLWSLNNSRLLTPEGREFYSEAMEATYLDRAAQEATQDTLYSWYLHLYNSFHWQASTVSTLAITAEANGLKLEMPFWDGRLQDFLSAMPESWGRGLDFNPTKYPLKWMLGNRIDYPMHLQVGPHSYLYDVDPSFSLAAETLYASAFAPYLRERLQSREYRELLSGRIFNVDYIESVIDRYLAVTEIHGAELNDLVSLCWLFAAGAYRG